MEVEISMTKKENQYAIRGLTCKAYLNAIKSCFIKTSQKTINLRLII